MRYKHKLLKVKKEIKMKNIKTVLVISALLSALSATAYADDSDYNDPPSWTTPDSVETYSDWQRSGFDEIDRYEDTNDSDDDYESDDSDYDSDGNYSSYSYGRGSSSGVR